MTADRLHYPFERYTHGKWRTFWILADSPAQADAIAIERFGFYPITCFSIRRAGTRVVIWLKGETVKSTEGGR